MRYRKDDTLLNDREYVEQSIGINLYFLRSLREYCFNIQTSFPPYETKYIQEANDLALRCEELGRRLMKIADGKLPSTAFEYPIFVTPYTLPLEELTQKLFQVPIATDITKKELTLKPGEVTPVSSELENEVTSINNESYEIASRFVMLSQMVYNELWKEDVFSYTYPTMYEFMFYDVELFRGELDRVMQKVKSDPTFAINYEFAFNNSMKTIAVFLYKLIDPRNEEIAREASNFITRFQSAEEKYKKTPLTPDNQLQLTKEEKELVLDFQGFMQRCIQSLLDKKAYFVIEPIFLDNMYTKINYFLYNLSEDIQKSS